MIVVLLREGATLGDVADLAASIRTHRVVEDARVEIAAPSLAKARPRERNDRARRRVGGGR